MSMHHVAAQYAARGWPVYPLAPMSKVPLKGSNGQNDATLDPDRIYRMWPFEDDESQNNIGIATGPAGLVVIDVDVKNDDVNGMESWFQLVDMAGLRTEPRTYEVETPSGGIHIYWQANEALPVKTVAGLLAPGIDVRAVNGSIVAAGSKTPEGEYRCVRDIDPRPLPNWLRAALRRRGLATSDVERQAMSPRPPVKEQSKYAEAALKGELEQLENIAEGSRNHELNKAAYKLRKFVDDGQLDAIHVADSLFEAAMKLGLSSKEAEQTIRSGLGG